MKKIPQKLEEAWTPAEAKDQSDINTFYEFVKMWEVNNKRFEKWKGIAERSPNPEAKHLLDIINGAEIAAIESMRRQDDYELDRELGESKWRDLWNKHSEWAEANKTSQRKDANYPSWQKQKDNIYSLSQTHGFDPEQIKKLTRQYDKIKGSSNRMMDSYEDWMDRKLKEVKIDQYGNHIEPQFKKGDQVTYLGHPGTITGVNDEHGRFSYNVLYDKGEGKTKVTNIWNKGDNPPIKLAETLNKSEADDLLNALYKDGNLIQPKGGNSIPGKNYEIKGKLGNDGLFFTPHPNSSSHPYGVVYISGHGLDRKFLNSLGFEQGRSWTAGVDNFYHDGNYRPKFLSEKEFMRLVDHFLGGAGRYGKSFADFYKDKKLSPGVGDMMEDEINEGEDQVNDAYNRVIELIRKESRRLNDDDSYELHEKLKEWFSSLFENKEQITESCSCPHKTKIQGLIRESLTNKKLKTK